MPDQADQTDKADNTFKGKVTNILDFHGTPVAAQALSETLGWLGRTAEEAARRRPPNRPEELRGKGWEKASLLALAELCRHLAPEVGTITTPREYGDADLFPTATSPERETDVVEVDPALATVLDVQQDGSLVAAVVTIETSTETEQAMQDSINAMHEQLSETLPAGPTSIETEPTGAEIEAPVKVSADHPVGQAVETVSAPVLQDPYGIHSPDPWYPPDGLPAIHAPDPWEATPGK